MSSFSNDIVLYSISVCTALYTYNFLNTLFKKQIKQNAILAYLLLAIVTGSLLVLISKKKNNKIKGEADEDDEDELPPEIL